MLECNKCLEFKPEIEFSKRSANKSGYNCRCKKCISELSAIYYQNNKDFVDQRNREYTLKNKETVALRKKEWKENNRERFRENAKNYKRNRKVIDPLFKLKENLRRRTQKAFKVSKWRKNNTTQDILGCTYEELFIHIENQFTEGMNWDNQGEWHIDHIKPLSIAESEEELKSLCHYTNLQPLWALDNIKKGNSF